MTEEMPLVNLLEGEDGTFVSCSCGQGLLGRLAALGFTPGSRITVLNNYNHGPLLLMVHGSRVALGRGEAAKVIVRKE